MRRLFPDNTFVAPKLGDGNIVVIAEAPGTEENAAGIPLVGGAGDWFNAMAAKAGLKRDDLTLANCIQCQPPKNLFPTDGDAQCYISKSEAYAAVEQCKRNHVLPLLKSQPWKKVLLLGDKALRFYTDKWGINKHRGAPLVIPELGDKPIAIATLHPAAIMRDQEMLPVVINDMRKDLNVPPEYYNLYPSLDDVKAFTATEFAFDIETPQYRELGDDAPISIVGLSDRLYNAIVVPFHGPYKDELKRIFKAAKSVVGHNCIQFDIPRLEREDVRIQQQCVVWDTMLLHHLRFPNLGGEDKTQGGHDLGFVGSQFTNKPAWKDDKGIFELYCARDVDVTYQVFQQLLPLVRQHGLERLYRLVQVPLAKICRLMNQTGFSIDPGQIDGVRVKLQGEMKELEKALPEDLQSNVKLVNKRYAAPPGTLSPKTGKPLKFLTRQEEETTRPWRSGELIAKWLYQDLKLPVQRDLKTGEITTGKMALDKLARFAYKEEPKGKVPAGTSAAINALRKLRKHNSLMTLFCKKEMVNVARMHPHFNPHGTASGRLSSSEPNLQNVPESARYIYVPSHAGWKIIDVDYSQIENRLTAYLAGDTERLKRFEDDPKFSEHKYAASVFFDIPLELVEKDNDKDAPYGKAKRIVHGSNYGMGAKKISMMYDMDFKEVKSMLLKWKQTLAKTVAWQDATAALAKRQGYLATPFGRKRWFYTNKAYTESLSFTPQSTAADIIFRAMIALMYKRIGWPEELVAQVVDYYEPLPEPANLLIQVHDSLVLEAPAEMVPQVVGVLQRVMCQPFKELHGFSVPVGVKVGDSWGLAEDYKLPA
jgi:uracil-DNA glycosylase family 4